MIFREYALSVGFAATSPKGGGLPRLSLWESSREAGERAIFRDVKGAAPYHGIS